MFVSIAAYTVGYYMCKHDITQIPNRLLTLGVLYLPLRRCLTIVVFIAPNGKCVPVFIFYCESKHFLFSESLSIKNIEIDR